tara:strand:- start:17244 stop:17465 length:222 start_codon:yes stop_codon:yes gene_type:complete
MSETIMFDVPLDFKSKENKRFIHAYIKRLIKKYTSEKNKRKLLQQKNDELQKYIDDTAELVVYARRVMEVMRP